LESITFPEPVIFVAIEPNEGRPRTRQGLARDVRIRTHKRLIDILDPTSKTVEALTAATAFRRRYRD